MKSRRIGNLSEGQQQRLPIARALASNPKVSLLDEPTEGIQPTIIREIACTLHKIRDQKGLTTIVGSEPVLKFALDVTDRLLLIENGIVVHNSPRDGIDEVNVSNFSQFRPKQEKIAPFQTRTVRMVLAAAVATVVQSRAGRHYTARMEQRAFQQSDLG